jgi:hypothetical protein
LENDESLIRDGRNYGCWRRRAAGLAVRINHWQTMCGKALSDLGGFDPHAERERRYEALAEHYRSNMKMDLVYRALDDERR